MVWDGWISFAGVLVNHWEPEKPQVLFQYVILSVQWRFVSATKKHFRSGRFVWCQWGLEVLGKGIIIRFLFLETGKIKVARDPERKRENHHFYKKSKISISILIRAKMKLKIRDYSPVTRGLFYFLSLLEFKWVRNLKLSYLTLFDIWI